MGGGLVNSNDDYQKFRAAMRERNGAEFGRPYRSFGMLGAVPALSTSFSIGLDLYATLCARPGFSRPWRLQLNRNNGTIRRQSRSRLANSVRGRVETRRPR